jgi:transposase
MKQEASVSQLHIERVDNLSIILHWLLKMQIQVIIDRIWYAHNNWQGLSYGQLAVLFVSYIIYQRSHRLSSMEKWVKEHHIVLEQVTGWSIGKKEATDDRLGNLLETLGSNENQIVEFQRQLGSHLIQAYELPTKVGRYDTTSFSVHHAPPETVYPAQDKAEQPRHDLLRFGYSKDKRPDLLQFKQGLGTLDPAGIPIVTHTLSGETADDGQYLPAWKEMCQIIGHRNWLMVSDSKAAARQTRATIDYGDGRYLFPVPMTGKRPEWLRKQLLNPPIEPEKIYLPDAVNKEKKLKAIGQGFVVERTMTEQLVDGTSHEWTEQWFVSQSFAHAKRTITSLQRRVSQAVDKLNSLRSKSEETAAKFQQRADQLLKQQKMGNYVTVTVFETITTTKRYLKPGRPTPDSPYHLIEQRHLSLKVQIDETALDEAYRLAGWRLYVSNVSTQEMSLTQATIYYRDEWLVENGFHRFKGGSLPTLPLFLHLPERIIGLMLLLLVALQALTLLEFVARRNLADLQEEVAGLVPGNPKRKTDRPTAERLLAVFTNLHLVVETGETEVKGYLNESLTPLQQQILALLNLPETIFDFCFTVPLSQFQ